MPNSPNSSYDSSVDFDNSFDDLGKYHGAFYFKHGGLAKQIVQRFGIVAFGERPVDYLERTLLFESLSRDRRMWVWRRLCEHRPPWMFDDTRGLPASQRRQIGQQRSLHFLHAAHLLELSDRADANDEREIDKLLRCWPVGSQVRWCPENSKPPKGNCDQPHHCPFCFARRVGQLYTQLTHALPAAEGRRGFYLAVATVADGDLAMLASREDQLHWARQEGLPAMRKWLESRGAHGGLVTFQVLPQRYGSLRWDGDETVPVDHDGFAYRLAVLAEFVPERHVFAGLRDMQATRGITITAGGVEVPIQLSVLNHLSANTLRILLAGHARSFDGEQILPECEGLFVLPSLTLCNYTQWRDRFQLLADQHLYDRWGSWRGMENPRTPPSLPLGSPASAGKRRRRNKLLLRNQQAKQAADDRVDDILREYGTKLIHAAEHAGKPLGRTALRLVLKDLGASITERQCRRLAKVLRNENQT